MFHAIECAQIDFDDTTFLMSYPLDAPEVMASVGMVGVVNPIVVTGCPCQGKYQIVAGFRRAYACREIGLEQIQAQIYPVDPENTLAAFSLALYENLAHRRLNTVEKALILTKLIRQFGCSRDEALELYMPALQLAPNERVLDTYLAVWTFDDALKTYLAEHDAPLAMLELFAGFAETDRQAVFRLMFALKIGQNKLRELLTHLDDIALRDGGSIADILAAESVQSILAHDTLPPPQKLDRLRQRIREQRYPHLAALEREYAAALKRLRPPRGVSLTTDRFFEDDAMTITFRAARADDMQTIGAELARLADTPEFQRILDLIQGKYYAI